MDRDVLAGSIEHYEDAALYDYEYRRRRADVNHYRRLARDLAAGGPILELGCGTGRVLAALARDGHHAVGIDTAPAMLARAADRLSRLPRAARPRARVLRGDMRAFAFKARFPLILSPFNTLQHLYETRDVEAALACVRDHLAPGGAFAFDVLNPDLDWLTRDPRRRWARTRFRHPTTGERWEYTTNQVYDPVSQIAHIRLYYAPVGEDGADRSRERVVRLAHRQFFPAELDGILRHSGFRVVEKWGDFDGQPFEGDSPSQVILCTPHRRETLTRQTGRV